MSALKGKAINMTPLKENDLPLIRSAGFKVGASGQVWFGVDKYDKMWRVHISESGRLIFSKEIDNNEWNNGQIITRYMFDSLFNDPLNRIVMRD